jgi:hypothetical protein
VKLSPSSVAFLERVAGKLNEKSSVYAYAMAFAGMFATKYQGLFARGASIVSLMAGVALWLLSDPQVRFLLTGKQPDEPKSPTVPKPFDSDPR